MQQTIAFSDQIRQEDIVLCEQVQRGLRSPPLIRAASRPSARTANITSSSRCASSSVWRTRRDVRGAAGAYLDTPFFRPEACGFGQADGPKATDRFLARYNETGSLKPSDNADVSRNASYLIGLILRARADGALD